MACSGNSSLLQETPPSPVDKFSLDSHPRRSPSPAATPVATPGATPGATPPASSPSGPPSAEAPASHVSLDFWLLFHVYAITILPGNRATRNVQLNTTKGEKTPKSESAPAERDHGWYDIGFSAEHQAMFRQKQLG